MKSWLFLFILFLPFISYSQPQKKFSLALYHFNIQYVAGGLKGLFPESPDFDLSQEDVEDLIVRESFEPLLDMFLKHPDWGADFELQGYFVEVLAQRHQDVLEKLRMLVGRGQIEIVSFHYSDQLFLAYPERDMEWSLRLNKKVFEENGLRVSSVVFTQEGQFGEGMAQFMKDNGFKIALMPKNLMRYLHPEVDTNPEPLYYLRDVMVILAGKGIYREDLIAEWSFFNDGELLATGGASPYLGKSIFKFHPEALQEYEDNLIQKQAQGYKIVKISQYVDELKGSGIIPEDIPPVLDGTWQPDDTLNLFRWMGDDAALNTKNADDNGVLTGNYKSRNKLVAIESLINYASQYGLLDKNHWMERIQKIWKYQLFAEVSDSTGWTPWEGEIKYSYDNRAIAEEMAEKLATELSETLNFYFRGIDSSTGEPLRELKNLNKLESPPLIPVEITAEGREVSVKWYFLPDYFAYELEIDFTSATDNRMVSVVFPLFADKIIYSPALLEHEIVEHDLNAFGFSEIALPLSNGLIGLGRDLFVIKDNGTVHLAGIISKEKRTVEFRDESAPLDKPFSFRFYILQGTGEKALKLADMINVHPVVAFNIPEEKGCGCNASGGQGDITGFLLVILSGILVLRRKLNTIGS